MAHEWWNNPDADVRFWVPDYIKMRAQVHDFPVAQGGQMVCRRCNFVLSMQTIYDLPALCLVKENHA